MNRKTIALVAAVMVIVFGGIVTLYPLLFNPEPGVPPKAGSPVEAAR